MRLFVNTRDDEGISNHIEPSHTAQKHQQKRIVLQAKMDRTRECCQRERYGFALYNRFKVPKLYKFAVDGHWDLIPQRCLSHPKEAQFVHFYPPSDTALHRILRTAMGSLEVDCESKRHIEQVELEAISALLGANRQAASTRDAFGRTPLHIACMDIGSCGEAAAYMIVDSCHKAAMMQDVEGRSPLHYLVGRNDYVPLALLSKLIAVFPKALNMKDNVMETPLETVLQREDELQDVEAIIQIMKTGEHSASIRIAEKPSDNSDVSSRSTETTNADGDHLCETFCAAKKANKRNTRTNTV